ncbi:Solute carrier family 26 (Sulfate anion transporter) member 6 [Fasciolopsis buskii]|uniref:Solute carrier family 26 (Sulfate anion transporter) member 6 n=1 Tax=Fasciolopsis buskii TaxID=27845 RepID=A0A8E0RT94_9TREM|nr:Solute carrier family 26 (Sulfate anion transporter) member 6 [Fasciolopsis buski]
MFGREKDSKLPEFLVTRHVMDVKFFDEKCCPRQIPKRPPFKALLRRRLSSLRVAGIISRTIPFYEILASFYTLQCFISDIIAGITMAIVHIPQGMAYGFLAGLKPINGLYTSFFPPLIYFFFGTSRHLSVGTFSVVALLASEPVDRLCDQMSTLNYTWNQTDSFTDERDSYRLSVAATVTILAGLIQLTMGLFRLGFLVVYISAPLLGGFTCASAVHVLSTQLNGLFGIRLQRYKGPGRLILTIIDFFRKVQNTNLATFIVSIICVTVLAVVHFVLNPRLIRRFHFPLPIELVVLIGGTVASYFIDLKAAYNVRIVGTIPRGLPTPRLPDFSLVPEVMMESCVVSFVALATTVSLVKLYAFRGGYDVQYNQEMTALGLANIAGGFFQGHSASGALARTSAAATAGMKSQVASLVSCMVLLLVLTSIGPLLESVPLAALSSIIAVSLVGILKQITDLPKLYRASVIDMLIWLVTFVATICLDVPYGLITGLMFSLLTVLYRTQVSFAQELAHVSGTELYVDPRYYVDAKRIPGVIILRYGGPLYYANMESFRYWITQCTHIDLNKIRRQESGSPAHVTLSSRLSGFSCCIRRQECNRSTQSAREEHKEERKQDRVAIQATVSVSQMHVMYILHKPVC